jgi:alpha-ribazole phosphatase
LTRLLLVRHGETEYNSSERYWGSTDVALGPAGLSQAQRLRERLSKENIQAVYSSPLKRAMTTAEAIAGSHNLKVIPCPEIKEIDFGKIEGLNFKEVNQLYPEVHQMWLEKSPRMAYPGGESLLQLETRVTRFAERLKPHGPDETVLVVAHSGVLRTMICQLLEMEMRHRWSFRVDLASLNIVETYPQGSILTLLNDITHLGERWK